MKEKEIYNDSNDFGGNLFNNISFIFKELSAAVPVKILNEYAKIPTQGSSDAAGNDLYAAITEPISIPPHTTVKIGTGLSFELPPCTFIGIFPRSGIATKRGLRPANCVGVCDPGYRGEYIVALHNDTNETQIVEPGERIAQMILLPFISMKFKEVDELSETERGAAGFGDSGRF